MANRSYLKSQRLKELSRYHQKLILVERENESLKKDKASLEQKVNLLKDVIERNRGELLMLLCCLVFWLFHLLTSLCAFVLDGTEAQREELSKSQEHCRLLTIERDNLRSELSDLQVGVEVVVSMVDPAGGSSSSKTLAERLREALHRITAFLTDSSRDYIAHVLGLVKSYWPEAKLAPLCDGMTTECDEDSFAKYVEEAKPVAEQIVKMLEQDSKAED